MLIHRLMFNHERLKFKLLKQLRVVIKKLKIQNNNSQKCMLCYKQKQYFLKTCKNNVWCHKKVDLCTYNLLQNQFINERLPYFVLFYNLACNLCYKMIGVTRILYYWVFLTIHCLLFEDSNVSSISVMVFQVYIGIQKKIDDTYPWW